MFWPNKDRYIRWELITTILWFLLDSSWLFQWRWMANTLAVLAGIAALWTAAHAERNAGDVAVALGILGWVFMNAFWVVGDINGIAWAVQAAKFFAAGVLLCLIVAIWVSRARAQLAEVLSRFRRFRF